MKKRFIKYGILLLILLFIVVIGLFVVKSINKEYNTICKLETADPAGNYNLKATYNIIYNKNGNTIKVEIREEYTELKENIIDKLYTTTNLLNTTMNQNYGGYTYKNEFKENQLIVKTIIDIENLNLKKYSKDMRLEKYVDEDNINKDAFIDKYQRIGAICEEDK